MACTCLHELGELRCRWQEIHREWRISRPFALADGNQDGHDGESLAVVPARGCGFAEFSVRVGDGIADEAEDDDMEAIVPVHHAAVAHRGHISLSKSHLFTERTVPPPARAR